MDLVRASHCVFKVRYHMVLCVKYRKWLVRDDVEVFLRDVLLGISARYGFLLDSIGCDGNHIHVFVGAAPRYSPSNVMQILKSISARRLFEEFPDFRKTLWGAEFWNDGGYIATVGEGVTEEIIKRYIEKQGSKEEKEDFKQMKLSLY